VLSANDRCGATAIRQISKDDPELASRKPSFRLGYAVDIGEQTSLADGFTGYFLRKTSIRTRPDSHHGFYVTNTAESPV
jgi:hypothetical protein